MATNGVTLCRTLAQIYKSDKLRLVLCRGYAKNHPVRLRLTPLHRRGMVRHYTYTDTPQPPCQAAPPGADARQSPQCICARHLPSTGGEWSGTILIQTRHNHPVRLRHRVQTRGNRPQCICARHLPSTGGEWSGTILIQTRHNHPVRPRHRVQTRGNRPNVSVLDISPPQEGNGPALYLYRHATTTPSGCATGCRREAIAPMYLC